MTTMSTAAEDLMDNFLAQWSATQLVQLGGCTNDEQTCSFWDHLYLLVFVKKIIDDKII